MREDTVSTATVPDAKGKGRADDVGMRGLRLRHWTRVPAITNKGDEDEYAEDTETYPFARYTSPNQIYSYTDEEYAVHINGKLYTFQSFNHILMCH